MLSSVTYWTTYWLQGFGYRNIDDFLSSAFHYKYISTLGLLTAAVIGYIATFIEDYIGVTVVVYIAFVVLLVGEFISGIAASLKQGKKIQSRKFGRMIVKIGAYTTILGVLNVFAKQLPSPEIFDFDINIHKWLFYAVFNMIIIQLLISVFENLDKLGLTETSFVLKVLKQRLNKWFLDESYDEQFDNKI